LAQSPEDALEQRREVLNRILWRCQYDDRQVESLKGLLVLHVAVNGDKDVECGLRTAKELAILHAGPTRFLNGDDFVTWK
jgi:hypothetical protein